ncbi:hypothetical protein GCM10020256_49520 [Streptomyces thermocoprophilus]
MFDTVLVANRGEIAVRVIRTLRRMGIRSVAVFSDADADARHVREADSTVRIGPPPAAESYLSAERLLEAAARTGAQAVHPGYGFLAENADFARACEEAGLVFIGPPAEAIALMGDKIRAKETVKAAGVPVVPGGRDPELAEAARELGAPVLLKPSAGGGGKGMRLVRDLSVLDEEIAAARREARASFGDDTLLVERWIDRPRHIEIQVLADGHGNVVHLGERECSLQRRHQKIVEEAPSVLLDEATRAAMGEAAVQAARSCGYRGAGTVEFIVPGADPSSYCFMEMNTRLQVEHPVTELITGLDLVEWQVRVAAGEPLGFRQEDVALTGHAVEARICAEDPSRGFLPSGGRVLLLRTAGRRRAHRLRAHRGHRGGQPVRPDAVEGRRVRPGPGDRAAPAARGPRGDGDAGRADQRGLPAPAARPPGRGLRGSGHGPGRARGRRPGPGRGAGGGVRGGGGRTAARAAARQRRLDGPVRGAERLAAGRRAEAGHLPAEGHRPRRAHPARHAHRHRRPGRGHPRRRPALLPPRRGLAGPRRRRLAGAGPRPGRGLPDGRRAHGRGLP